MSVLAVEASVFCAEGNETVTNCHGLKMRADDGKMRLTDCLDTKGVLRLVQSVPSPKVEPFKMWLAQVGSELVTNCNRLKMRADDGKMRLTDCLDTKGVLRLVQSVPSPKAEPCNAP